MLYTFYLLLLICLDLYICKLLEILYLKNKWKLSSPVLCQSKVHVFQVLIQYDPLACGRKIIECLFTSFYFNVYLCEGFIITMEVHVYNL